jgi:diaminohydroxyphosphoribosylaminopyrimidine deaminase/5-amino-6-(5-phosphoribosylamino)uracil reductase
MLDIPLESRIIQTSGQYPSLIFCSETAPPDRQAAIKEHGIEIIQVPKSGISLDLTAILDHFHLKGCYSVLLECGSTLSTAFLKAGLVDKAYIFYAPKLLGGARTGVDDLGITSIGGAMDFRFESIKRSGDDLLCIAYPVET